MTIVVEKFTDTWRRRPHAGSRAVEAVDEVGNPTILRRSLVIAAVLDDGVGPG
jgi:hypothetical protein